MRQVELGYLIYLAFGICPFILCFLGDPSQSNIFIFLLYWQFDKLALVWGKPRQPPLGPEEVSAGFSGNLLYVRVSAL